MKQVTKFDWLRCFFRIGRMDVAATETAALRLHLR
jgi:hypothetical protein